MPAETLPKGQLDFVWQAADGSRAIAHYLINSYSFGNRLTKESPGQAMNDFVDAYRPSGTPPHYAATATNFMYIPIDDDFSMPVPGLIDDIDKWNNNTLPYGRGATATNVLAVAGTFDTFINQIKPSASALPLLKPYNGTPYWTGYYASRPALKIFHYEAMRALVAAEIFGLLTQPGNPQLNNMLPGAFWDDVAGTWSDFAPSTHHDYVCGTALDAIYANEQLPLIQAVAARARGLRAAALSALAGMVPSTAGYQQLSVLVANSLGFARNGLTEVANVVFPGVASVTFDGNSFAPVQRSAEGGMLFMAPSVPSFGYLTGNLSTSSPTPPAARTTISPTTPGASRYTLDNSFLTAVIDGATGSISSLIDKRTGRNVLAAGAPGNDMMFYKDGGDLYRFGNEYGDADHKFEYDPHINVSATNAIVLESGPLRVRLRITQQLSVGTGETREFTREYALVADEPFLRMSTTGAAPLGQPDENYGYSVMARFVFASMPARIVHGTAYHWTDVQPLPNWYPPIFQATHDFLLPQDASGKILAAIYHSATPAWAIDDGAVIGCILRNTTRPAWGASGSDPAAHTHHYALRVPSDLYGPATAQPLAEALARPCRRSRFRPAKDSPERLPRAGAWPP
jgi:alpha-mannosidase